MRACLNVLSCLGRRKDRPLRSEFRWREVGAGGIARLRSRQILCYYCGAIFYEGFFGFCEGAGEIAFYVQLGG